MTRRLFSYMGAALASAGLVVPAELPAKTPPLRTAARSGAPALLAPPPVGQASPLLPVDSAVELEPADVEATPQPHLFGPPAKAAKTSEPLTTHEIDDTLEVPPTHEGQWTHWDHGRALWTCEFHQGMRHGKATRFFSEGEGPLFAEPLADGFKPPFQAQAVFVEGKLTGTCTIVDSQKQTLCELSLKDDELEGESTWYYPSGQQREVSHYHSGRLAGTRLEYSAEGKLVKEEEYLAGRLTTNEIADYETGQKQMRGQYYLAGAMEYLRFNWLRGEFDAAVLENYPSDVRTGKWTWWHPTGQRQLEGSYDEDRPSGTFTWWYVNGQKERQGSYTDGLQSGKWTWWYQSGQKQIEGFYVAGELTGDWQFWQEDGKLVQGDAAKVTSRTPPQPAPQVRIVRKPQPSQRTTR